MPLKKTLTLDGLPVVDATEPLVIQIEKADIRRKSRRDPEHCAVAEACKRELQVSEARAYLSRLYIRQGDHWVRYWLPESIRTEIQVFDRGGSFTTGTYRIPPPGAYKRSTRRDGPPRPYNRSPSQEQHRIQMTHRQVEGLRHCSPLQGGAKEWTQDTPQLAPAIALIEAEPEK